MGASAQEILLGSCHQCAKMKLQAHTPKHMHTRVLVQCICVPSLVWSSKHMASKGHTRVYALMHIHTHGFARTLAPTRTHMRALITHPQAAAQAPHQARTCEGRELLYLQPPADRQAAGWADGAHRRGGDAGGPGGAHHRGADGAAGGTWVGGPGGGRIMEWPGQDAVLWSAGQGGCV